MPALSEKTRARIEQLIRDHHLAFQVEVLGPTSIPREDLERLQRSGVLTIPDEASQGRGMVSVPAMHTLGVIASRSGEQSVEKMSEEAFWQYIAHAPPNLMSHERDAIQAARASIGRSISGLGDEAVGEFARAVRDEDAKLRHDDVISAAKHEAAKMAAKTNAANIIAARLRRKFKKLNRDWLMIATTELHNVTEEGRANAILSSVAPGVDPRVFKRPRTDACKFCKLLYLVDGKRPRLFRLSQLVANGTNHDRRAKRPTLRGVNATEWKPTLGALHPWCQCTLFMLPDGFSFDSDGNMVFVGIKKSLDDVVYLTPELHALLNHECEA